MIYFIVGFGLLTTLTLLRAIYLMGVAEGRCKSRQFHHRLRASKGEIENRH